jgi:Kef-type K+ transport system membrane component KefB
MEGLMPMLRPTESRDLRKAMSRLGWFLLGVLLIDSFIAFLLYKYVPTIHPVLCGFIIIVFTTILYICYSLIFAKVDKKRKEKLEKSGQKDPFTRK